MEQDTFIIIFLESHCIMSKLKQDKKVPYDEEKYYKRNDNIYYNVKIINNRMGEAKLARYIETRLTPIIGDHARDYYCTVARLKVPSTSIPIFVFQPGDYKVTMTDTDGNDWTADCQWVDNGSNTNYVRTYSEWALSVTNGLEAAYNLIPALLQPANPPFLLFDNVSQLFTLYATSEYNSVPNEAGKTQIWMNVGTFSKFESFTTFRGSPQSDKFVNILNKRDGSNMIIADFKAPVGPILNCSPAVDGVTYFAQIQEHKSLFLLSDFDSLVITSTTIPVSPEQYGSIDGVSSQEQNNVLTDVQPDLDNYVSAHGYFIYSPFIYRWFDVPSSASISTLDLQIYWRDVRGILNPIYVYYNDVVDIKLLFKKKYEHVVIDKNLD